jgi:hypothetical protein
MKSKELTREQLIDILESYVRMIARNGADYPTATLSELYASLHSVLARCGMPEYSDYKQEA